MAIINKQDTNGTKPLLGKGELGYDDYTAGGDTGRVYVGTSGENIQLAKRIEANLMTKAQFNALAEERKANRAGSGFDEWGKQSIIGDGYLPVNEGMWTAPVSVNFPNTIFIGAPATTANDSGISKTRYPVANINGTRCNLSYINASTAPRATILLPTAPNIYPYDTVLTAEQIASGIIKHADASNSGLIVNGKFDTDTSGWTLTNGVWDNGSMRIGPAGTTNFININVVIGKTYRIEYDYFNQTGFRVSLGVSFNAGTTYTWYDDYSKSDGKYYANVTATSAIMQIDFRARGGDSYANIDNIAVYPLDAISRSDLVFLESWHEDISEKNFVYPLGNVQYLGFNTDGLTGIANGAFTGFETYSLFGNWQTPSALIGKGYVWSSLTEAQRKAFIANPDNNCYLDGDKVIQVRYRVRVVQGAGDSWLNTDVTNPTTSGISLQFSSSLKVETKGKQVSISTDLMNGTIFYNKANATYGINADTGTFVSFPSSTVSYNNLVFALPIALVHR